jgi:ATP-dependent protease ClpP protease subunit
MEDKSPKSSKIYKRTLESHPGFFRAIEKIDMLHQYGIDLDSATIYFATEIDGTLTISLRIKTEMIKKYWKENKNEDIKRITIIFCSPGGDATIMAAIADFYDYYKNQGIFFDILAEGICYSAASLMIGHASGIRRATKRTRFMIHELQIKSVEGTATQTKAAQKEIDYIQEDALKAYVYLYCKKKYGGLENISGKEYKEITEKFDNMMKKETYLNANEALELGLIDEII